MIIQGYTSVAYRTCYLGNEHVTYLPNSTPNSGQRLRPRLSWEISNQFIYFCRLIDGFREADRYEHPQNL